MSLKGSAESRNVLHGNANKIDKLHGKSAYEIAVMSGYNGTVEEWLAAMKGDKGDPGKDGYTPIKGIDYFDGSNGKDGKDGADGKDGKDYVLTPTDKTEIANLVLADFPIAEEISV